ncbi:MAG: C25 family cysteine peptidase, partial [Candidatus Fermentibacteraceae bacterium]
MILIFLIAEFLSVNPSSGSVDGLYLDFPAPSTVSCRGFTSYEIDGCSGMDDVHLPVRYVRLPIEPGTTPQVRVEVTGTRILGPSAGVASSFFTEDGTEAFREASSFLLPDQWSRVVQYGTWRRAGFVEVALYPVTARGGELLCASGMRVVIEGQGASSSRRVPGHQGLLYDLFFETGNGYTLEPRSRMGSSPFWGRPWARIQVDTAGVFQVTGEHLPQAVGMPSSSFSMYCGLGRGMNEDTPWNNSFEPIPVPVLVEDGGDGVFDGSDRVLFYGRGLSWWDDRIGFDGLHFNGQYDSLNTYWLTWGEAGGPFMEVRDCSITGAPSATDHYLGRHHLEKNYIRETSVWDYWSWSRLAGSHTQTANLNFDTQGATGPGQVRVGLVLSAGQAKVTAILNGVTQGDTLLASTGRHILTFGVSGFKNAGNSLGIRFSQVSGSYTVNFDWVSVFPEKSFSSSSTAMEVPLVFSIPIGERRRVDWAQNLDQARAFLVNGDDLIHALDLPGGNAFEVEVPYGWRMPVMYMYPTGSLPEPYSVTPASPGRIRGTLSGGDIIVFYPDEFEPDMPLLDRPDGRSRVFVSLTEVWDEFNGGVRDPQAVRAMLDWVMQTWDPLPTEVVLVGAGHFDPRHFLYSQPCPMDVLVTRLSDEGVSDDRYGVVSGSAEPQFGVSRLLASNRSELQILAQRALDYFTLAASGEWQSEVIAAADDEMHLGEYWEDEHTVQSESIIASLPGRFFVDRQYGIFHTWNDADKKPEWRQSFIDAWSRGALVLFFMGHGSYDQIADEGRFYLEDWAQLENGARLPYAFFGSCDVGMFQYPGRKCISGEVTLPPSGGAITSLGASLKTQGYNNRDMLKSIFSVLLTSPDLSMSEATFMGKINHSGGEDAYYIMFGDGSLGLALPDSGITHSFPVMRTGEMTTFEGALTG